jgi:poly(A) polymerase
MQKVQVSADTMAAKIGGRIVRPALPIVDGAPPTPVEAGFQQSLQEYASQNIPLESREGIERRERVLDRMRSLSREWIKSVCRSKGLPSEVVENAGGMLFTSGSYRLGVHEPGADIDAILVAPAMCSRSDFFGRINPSTSTVASNDEESSSTANERDPYSLAERIRRHPDVTNFVAVESAAVPILTFDWESINIDLLFARINSNSVTDFDIDNDASLSGADSATEKSLNGPRVTNLIAALVSGTPQRYQTFLQVVRYVRKWAKARGIYSNKSGYWGGVNINIGVALVVQLYPNACAASLLRKFFLVFKTWRWPQPVLLTKPHDAGYGLPVWNPQTARGQVAPMITPAYPAMNSTLSISRQTLQILQGEFERAHSIVDKLWKHHNREPGASLDWSVLFEPSDFFIAFPVSLRPTGGCRCKTLFFDLS